MLIGLSLLKDAIGKVLILELIILIAKINKDMLDIFRRKV
jgi:hypothetical protein